MVSVEKMTLHEGVESTLKIVLGAGNWLGSRRHEGA